VDEPSFSAPTSYIISGWPEDAGLRCRDVAAHLDDAAASESGAAMAALFSSVMWGMTWTSCPRYRRASF
jgi:hypothetical protein